MQLFYEPELLNNNGVLNPDESHHCIRVLRHVAGDYIKVIDGKGNLFTCIITEANQKKCKIEIESRTTQAPVDYVTHIAVAPTKNIDRLEWFLEKGTEIGIEIITPILCTNSERRVIKIDRLEKVITSAVKQSIDLWRPQLMPMIDFASFVTQPFNGDKFIAHCRDENDAHLKLQYKKGNSVTILIGPEGDFTESEIELALQNGFKPVTLGAKRLRTETAALVAGHTIRLIND